jgi:hypothetical protein
MPPRSPLLLALLPALSLLGCNSYEVLRVTGYEQASFSNDADILFVIDNSSSMQEEAEALARNFDTFITKLTSAEGGNVGTATLGDAMENYIREKSGSSLFIDYQLGITTTSVMFAGGETSGIDRGEAGLLIGDVIGRAPDAGQRFQEQLLCEATCWNSVTLPSDPAFVCPAEGTAPTLGDAVTSEYLDCLCGTDAWKGHCGAGQEMGIEAGLLGLCRAADAPPEACGEFPANAPIGFTEADVGSNGGFMREGASSIVVIVSDEGDDSPRKDGVGDTDVSPYLDLFSEFPNPVKFAVIGPPWKDNDGGCLAGAQPWAVERYQNVANETNGIYVDLTDLEADCALSDFSANLERLGDLLSQLKTFFPLQSVPDAATITAWVDDVEVAPAEVLSGSVEAGDAEYGDGWSYDAAQNAVRFHGSAVPGYNADVRIFYRPIAGMPRELPF